MRWSLPKRFKSVRWWAPVAGLLAACVSPPLESPQPKTVQQTPIRVAQNIKNKVDVLFVIDSSASMSPMSSELRERFQQFFKVFQDLSAKGTYADLQIGVVTTDYGAGATGAPGCTPSPGGQQGRLVDVGAFAPQTCKPPLGARFIKYAFQANGTPTTNLPMDQDLIETFKCMGTVVTEMNAGCGFEHVLESAYAALHNNIPENAGFLRKDALLTVVFVTNEDDCSAPTDSDMFDKARVAQYGYLSSFRCSRFGVACNGQLLPYSDSMGFLSGCGSAPNPGGGGPGKLFDISRYVNFFTKPASQGGVKISPLDVILVGIDAPADPVQVILSNPGTPGGQPYQQCGVLNEQANPPCVPVLQHSCQNPARPVFFGDPAVRVNAVINAAANHDISSICADDYTPALRKLAELIVSQIGGGCIPSPLPKKDPAGGNDVANLVADCIVEDETRNDDGSVSISQIPKCEESGGKFPCWKLEVKDTCKSASPEQSVGVTIDRNNMPAPSNTEARVACATIAQ